MEFWWHPNCPSEAERERQAKRYYFDHGTGIYYWHKACGGDVVLVRDSSLLEGHFSRIGKADYKTTYPRYTSDSGRSMNQELKMNFVLVEAAQKMGLDHLLDP
jgi:hypothetical protein